MENFQGNKDEIESSSSIVELEATNSEAEYFPLSVPVRDSPLTFPVTSAPSLTVKRRGVSPIELMECHPCREKDQNTAAEFWCTECEEALCSSCKYLHEKFKLSRNHNVSELPSTNVYRLPVRRIMLQVMEMTNGILVINIPIHLWNIIALNKRNRIVFFVKYSKIEIVAKLKRLMK
ncbi:PML [Mytilus coruscus]|uniref:PML n=1 Tax=Mytilus coruscus TaxID=42192 RepID=A0A6J8C6U5_MYTCO|nr:PML [Mytilus coruscus]